MKTKRLFLTFALLGFFQLVYAQTTVNVSGHLDNTAGAAINLYLSHNDAGTWVNATAVTDVNGDYATSFTTNATQGTFYIYTHDCNTWDTLDATLSFFPDTNAVNTSTVVVPTMDYCPSSTSSCYAAFTLSQGTTANGAAIPGTVVVTDSSFGTNLTYTWSFGDGNTGTGTQLTHAYSGNGPYALCLTVDDGAGCVDTYCDSVSIDSLGFLESEGFTLVIGELNLNISDNEISNVKLYPNPASDMINIEFDTHGKELSDIRMFDLSGKLVLQQNTNQFSGANIVTINTENVEPGTYLIQMSFDNKLLNQKVIIK